ncbi:hypothetical protein L5515_015724 [Caenorhabditis briggsae]|uniref:Uncharacterized protein n=1 Tax=Caenorhabditis briggsae TaxID=6238 RepID=A0AAE9J9M8_CAEBR|nr:hypothetical protein L5515_015724 [Caenorhabditis briggsae]
MTSCVEVSVLYFFEKYSDKFIIPEQQNDQINEKMPPSVRPVNGEMEIPVKVESIEEEENNMQLIVFDVIQEDVPQDTEARI